MAITIIYFQGDSYGNAVETTAFGLAILLIGHGKVFLRLLGKVAISFGEGYQKKPIKDILRDIALEKIRLGKQVRRRLATV